MPPPDHRYSLTAHPTGSTRLTGVFFGYVLTAGCKFTGRYLVVALSDFDNVRLEEASTTGKIVFPVPVRKILWPVAGAEVNWKFPLADKYTARNEAAMGRDKTGMVPGHRG